MMTLFLLKELSTTLNASLSILFYLFHAHTHPPVPSITAQCANSPECPSLSTVTSNITRPPRTIIDVTANIPFPPPYPPCLSFPWRSISGLVPGATVPTVIPPITWEWSQWWSFWAADQIWWDLPRRTAAFCIKAWNKEALYLEGSDSFLTCLGEEHPSGLRWRAREDNTARGKAPHARQGRRREREGGGGFGPAWECARVFTWGERERKWEDRGKGKRRVPRRGRGEFLTWAALSFVGSVWRRCFEGEGEGSCLVLVWKHSIDGEGKAVVGGECCFAGRCRIWRGRTSRSRLGSTMWGKP